MFTESSPPSSAVLIFVPWLPEEPALEDGSSADEGVPYNAGWKGAGKPMELGVIHFERNMRWADACVAWSVAC